MRKSSIIRLAAGAILLGGVWLAHTQQAPPPSKLNTIKLKDDLYVIHNDFVPGNTTVMVTNDGVVMVDDKFPQDHANIMAELKKITDKPVKYIFNTHHHFDHSGGNAQMQMMGAEVIQHANAHENTMTLKQPGAGQVTFTQESDVWLGGKHVEAHYYGRSHTNGDIVILFPAQRVLAAGDMYTKGDDVPELIDYSGGGSAAEWPKTLSGALTLDFDTVVPGHGPMSTKQEMTAFRASTIRLVDRVREMNRAKKKKEEIAQMLRTEFHWADLHLGRGLNGVIEEVQ